MSPRKRDFNFDNMLGTDENKEKEPQGSTPATPGIQEAVSGVPAPSLLPVAAPTQESVIPVSQETSTTGLQEASEAGLQESGKPATQNPRNIGIQDPVSDSPSPSPASQPDAVTLQEPVIPGSQEPTKPVLPEAGDVGLQEPGCPEVQDSRNTAIQEPGESMGETDIERVISSLLLAHAGLGTGTAKKATFDFTPEFARALKRWSADTDVSMRDLVVRAVALVMPQEYLQKPRTTGIQGYRNPGK